MKTRILQLAPEDDWHAAVERLEAEPRARILVGWPKRGGPRPPRMAMTLLKRRAHALGSPLAVSSESGRALHMAQELGIPIFGSIREGRQRNWPIPQPLPKPAARAERPAPHELRQRAAARRGLPATLPRSSRIILFALAVAGFLLASLALFGLGAG
jgi:hypothetical protein